VRQELESKVRQEYRATQVSREKQELVFREKQGFRASQELGFRARQAFRVTQELVSKVRQVSKEKLGHRETQEFRETLV